jgi:nicotinamide-nucleotide amidase
MASWRGQEVLEHGDVISQEHDLADDVLQLAHVSRPLIAQEALHGLGGRPRTRAPVTQGIYVEKLADENGNLVGAQGWQPDAHHAQARARDLLTPHRDLGYPRPEVTTMNDLSSMGSGVGGLLMARHETVAVAESSAGGLISAALLAVPGASAYFLGGAVIYTQAARRALLRVPDEGVAGMRSSSEPYALLKARSVRELLGTTWGLSETGATGPTGNRYGDAAGHACLAVAGPVERVITLETGAADRTANMWRFAQAALALLADCIGAVGPRR